MSLSLFYRLLVLFYVRSYKYLPSILYTDESFPREQWKRVLVCLCVYVFVLVCVRIANRASVELVVLEAVVLFAVWDELLLVYRFIILIPSLYPRFLHGVQYSSIITASPVRAVVVAVPSVRSLHTSADRLRRRWRHQLLWLCDRIAGIPPHQVTPRVSYQLAIVIEHVAV